MPDTRLYTYLPKDNTEATDGILSTALSEQGWEKYRGRTGKDSKEEVLAALDSWDPTFRRSYGISAFRSPIPDYADADFRAFADAKDLYSFDAAQLLAAGILRQMHGINTGRRGTHKIKRLPYKGPDWGSKKPGRFLFSNVPHYIVETRDGRIPPEYVTKEDDKRYRVKGAILGCMTGDMPHKVTEKLDGDPWKAVIESDGAISMDDVRKWHAAHQADPDGKKVPYYFVVEDSKTGDEFVWYTDDDNWMPINNPRQIKAAVAAGKQKGLVPEQLDFGQDKTAALGILDRSDLGDLSALKEDTIATLVRQRHNADRARLHEDMRIGGPSGLYSWAVPKFMPEDGSRRLAIQQPVHRWSYKDFQGRLKHGYGKGVVEKMEESNVVILKNSGNHIMFTRGDMRDAPIYNLVRTKGQNWLLSIYRKDQPVQVKLYPKEHFKQVPMDKVPELIANGATVTKKLDGAGTLLWLGKDGVRAFGIRTNAKGQKPEYTDAIGGLRSLRVPKDLQDTLLRGEVIGVSKNKAISPNELSGILNATTMNAAMKRQGDGIKLLVAALATHENGIDNYDQQRVNDIVARLNSEHVAPMSTYSGDAALKLLKTLQAGGDPMTHEGVVIHQQGKRPLKAKFKDDYDAIIDGIFKAELQPGAKPRAGGFTYTLPGHSGTVGKVGTGFTHQMLVDMLKNPDSYIGRTARVASQEQYPSGALRAPSFISMKED